MKIKLPWQRRDRLSEWLPWLLPIDDEREIILTNSGGLLRCAKLELPDFESESPESLLAHHDRLQDALARFGNGWSIWLDQWRVEAPGYLPEGNMNGNHAARLIDASRRRQFTDLARPVFKNTAFLAIHYQPQQRDAFLAWLMDRDDANVSAHVSFFEEHSSALFEQLKHTLRGVERLAGDDLASYLSASITYDPKRTMFPTGAVAAQFASREWETGYPLRIEDRYVATVEVRNFGSPSPMTCEALHELPFPCRWCVTLHGLDADARRAEIGEVRKRWRTKQKGIGAILTEIVTKNPFAGRVDPEAEQALVNLDVMQRDLAWRPFALTHANVHVWATDADLALERAGKVASLLKAQGLEASVATLNNVFAPLADMPGNVSQETANVRRARVEIGAITRLAPVTGVSIGTREDRRFGGPALLAGLTRRGVPFFWSMNGPNSDLPHTEIIGKSGGGKSTLVSLMAAQFQRYGNARILVFDRRRSFMVACLAMGGDWIELGTGQPAVQPLREIHIPAEQGWAHGWIIGALRKRGLMIAPAVDAAITEALVALAQYPKDRRTLTQFSAFLGSHEETRTALRYYLNGGGPYGQMFDGIVPSYGDSPVVGIETVTMKDLPEATPLVMTALFHAMQRDRLSGIDPKLVVIDEAWSLLQDPLFRSEIESWSRENRKLKAALVLATQSIDDLADESVQVIRGQMANHIYTAQPEAQTPAMKALYKKSGRSEEEIRTITRMAAKTEYLLCTEVATRLVQIRLEGDALALCGSSSVEDHERAWDLLEQGIKPGQEFCDAWLSETTVEWLERRRTAHLMAAE